MIQAKGKGGMAQNGGGVMRRWEKQLKSHRARQGANGRVWTIWGSFKFKNTNNLNLKLIDSDCTVDRLNSVSYQKKKKKGKRRI
jgi:hypothetical protein